MREVAPGDLIFSFRDTRIAALGIARTYCYESPKPTEFGTAGSYWEAIGWKIDVTFRELTNRIHPKSHIGELRGLLPEKYSLLRANADGLQSVYLAEVGGRSPRRCSASLAAKPTRLRMSRRKTIARFG
jgi:putative restriction endonuclease